jgi:hypothetical protein
VGLDHPKYNSLRQRAAMVGAALIVIGFIIVPISVQTGVLLPVSPETASNDADTGRAE